MVGSRTTEDLLDRADAARAAGRGEVAGPLYDEAAARCRDVDDLEGWTRAVLGVASTYVFGSEPGRLPAQLFDVLARTTDASNRARLAAALARCWAYAGQRSRAVSFADEALAQAELGAAPDVMAECLDAALAAHWGPDELPQRRTLTVRLGDVAAHVLDPEARLRAHLWGLQVACEMLDLQAMHREMRALERLGEESPRALFFAASRRQMLDLLRDRTDTSATLITMASAAADGAALADAWMVLKSMDAYAAAQSGDRARCAGAADEMEAFGVAEGVTAVCAEAAYLFACADEPARVRRLVNMFQGEVLEELPRDVNWLLTLQCVLEAALAVRECAVVGIAARLLTPYSGRPVFNAGAVAFHGVTDDTLSRAADLCGDADTAARLRERALSTYQRIGAQWWHRRLAAWPPASGRSAGVEPVHLHPVPGGLWQIGSGSGAAPLREMRGFSYLRELVGHPGEQIPALDLAGGGTGVVVQPALDAAVDHQAVNAYRQRLRDLDTELDEADQWSDLGRLESVRAEKDALLSELARAAGLHGHVRLRGSTHERARVAVKKAITAAIGRIATVDPALARHFDASIRTGLQCAYEPTPSEQTREWILG